jgi:hypothetical protein
MKDRLISVRQTWAAIVALGLASGLSCGLVVLRKSYAGTSGQLFFLWNLFLAWVPLGAGAGLLRARGEAQFALDGHAGRERRLAPLFSQRAVYRHGYRAPAPAARRCPTGTT